MSEDLQISRYHLQSVNRDKCVENEARQNGRFLDFHVTSSYLSLAKASEMSGRKSIHRNFITSFLMATS